jgi:kanamycin kinase
MDGTAAAEELPHDLRERYAGWSWTVAWSYGGTPTVWCVTRGHQRLFVKVRPLDAYPSIAHEWARLEWARSFVTVPTVVAQGGDDQQAWMAMEPLPGADATVHPWREENPAALVGALARDLRAFHDALPVDRCPFPGGLAASIDGARARVAAGQIDPELDLHPEFRHLSPEQALAELERVAPGFEDRVVCHGDYCVPNVMFAPDGTLTGYLDVGELCIADRRADLVVGAWSATWNFGPGHEQCYYDAYGLTPSADEVTFYRLLYDLSEG